MKNLRDDDKIVINNYTMNYLFSKSSNKNIKLIFKQIGKLLFSLLNMLIIFFIQKNLITKSDREKWVDLAYKIALPVLENMSKGLLHKNMSYEYSPNFHNGDKNVLFMECFGRLMDGISPWLSLPEDDTKEGKIRKKLHELALKSYKNAVDPNSRDMLLWNANDSSQPLVDAAYLAESFLRAPSTTWDKLDELTQKRYIKCFGIIRKIKPYYNNWLLFSGIIECFFIMFGKKPDIDKLYYITNTINGWYIGDGWYSDGPIFHMNYYNSFVIHPMFIHILEIMEKNNLKAPISSKLALKRMQRFNIFLERLISPEGYFPAFGRSIVYRVGCFQTLALSIWKYRLPDNLTNGGVRSALTKVLENMFKIKGNFNKNKYLNLGFVGHQPNVANTYSNSGSTYITSLIFLPLGFPDNHLFWTDSPKLWTSQKAWTGQPFPIDDNVSLK